MTIYFILKAKSLFRLKYRYQVLKLFEEEKFSSGINLQNNIFFVF